jgi:hypothetical protein
MLNLDLHALWVTSDGRLANAIEHVNAKEDALFIALVKTSKSSAWRIDRLTTRGFKESKSGEARGRERQK